MGALLRQLHIEVGGAPRVRAAFNTQIQPRMRLDNAGKLCQLEFRVLAQSVFAGLKQDIRHIHNQAAGCICRLQDFVQLLQQLSSQGKFMKNPDDAPSHLVEHFLFD